MQNSNRREFIKASAAAGASIVAVPAVAKEGGSPNDRVRLAIAGLGGRGRNSHMNALHQMAKENVEIVALCECDEKRLEASGAKHEKETGKKAVLYKDYRKLLEDKSIDAVTIAMPDHWHALATIWACRAGKDVYCEKPVSHNISEGRKMVQAARKYKRIVQAGTQCRSSPNIREGIRKLHEGIIGRVYMARGIAYKYRAGGKNEFGPVPPNLDWNYWQGPASEKPYNRLAIYRWRFLKHYGSGEIGDQGVHQLDIIRWGLKMDTHPNWAQAMGGKLFRPTSEVTTPGNLAFACQWEEPETQVMFETRDGFTNPEAGMGTQYPFVDHRNVVGVIFLGTEGYMIIPDYSSYHTFLGRKRELGPTASTTGAPMMDLDHFQNWIGAVRGRKPSDLFAEIEEGHKSATLAHLANAAYRTRQTLQFDPQAERFLNSAEANKLLTRDYRAPFVVPDEV